MDNVQQFAEATQKLPALYTQLMRSRLDQIEHNVGNKAGVYALIEGDLAQYVGRTRNLKRRLVGHRSKSHYSATCAFKLTRLKLGRKPTYQKIGSRSWLLEKDHEFKTEFEIQRQRVLRMKVGFVEIDDTLTQYLFEAYAILASELKAEDWLKTT
jgi:predicted GIY-YIG superfamily endonuclease